MEKVYRILSGIFLILLTIALGILTILVSRAAVAKTPLSLPLMIDLVFTIDVVLLLYGICSILTGLLKRSHLTQHDSFPRWYQQAEIRRGILVEFIGLIGFIVILTLLH